MLNIPRIEDVYIECEADYCRREAQKLLAKASLLDQQNSLAKRREAIFKAKRKPKKVLVFTKQKRHGVAIHPDLLAKIRSI